jgi:hypothetical protein
MIVFLNSYVGRSYMEPRLLVVNLNSFALQALLEPRSLRLSLDKQWERNHCQLLQRLIATCHFRSHQWLS